MAVDKITKRILDPSLLGEIEAKATKEELQEYRKKSIQIIEDDLNASLRTKINSGGGSIGAGGYDDSDLRTRIQTLEVDKADKTDFNIYLKNTDKVTSSMLDSDLKDIIDHKADKSELDSKIDVAKVVTDYRAKAVDITEEDLSEDLRFRINSNASAGGVPASLLQDIENIKDVNFLQNIDIQNIQNGLTNFRKLNVPIVEADLETVIANKINKARQNTVKISEADLERDLINRLNNINNAQNSVDSKVSSIETIILSGSNGSILYSHPNSIDMARYDWLAKSGNYFYTDDEIAYARNSGINEYYDLNKKHYYILDNDDWILVDENILESSDIVNRLLFNPMLSAVYLINGNGDVFKVSENNKVEKQIVQIAANGNYIIDIANIFGIGISTTDVNIDVKVKDSIANSRSKGNWINSHAVATIAVEADTATSLGRTITIYNDADELLEYLIILSARKNGPQL